MSTSRTIPARSARALLAGLPCLLLGLPAIAQTNPPPPTTTALSAATPFTGAAGGFESPQVATFAYNPTWSPWTFQALSHSQPTGGGATITRGSGIAKNGSGIVAASAAAPEGTGVAFLHGRGQASVDHAFLPGTWRLRFLAAQRVSGTTADTQVIRVTVDGRTVFEGEPGAAFEEHATAPFTTTGTTPVSVVFQGLRGTNGGQIALLDRVLLDPIRAWSDPTTWSNGRPEADDDALIPAQVAVAMDGACLAATVQVQGLLTADAAGGSLTTRWVLVSGADGHLRIGTKDQPYLGDFEVVLIGKDTGENILGAGTKFVMAMGGGQIDLHGAPKTPWSKLTSLRPATQGSTTIGVTDAAGWQIGDRVLVAYTGWMDHTAPANWSTRSSTGTITTIDPLAGTVTIDTALTAADHCSAAPTTWPANPNPGQRTWTLDQRAEVGNLSRNIRIVGDVSTSPGFGGHVMIMGMPNGVHGRARIDNVRLFQLGQTRKLGRYPMHWHMQHDNGAGQYFRNCAVEKSFNRAITIHGTNYADVSDNVCFDQMGHAVFLEDGVEQHNEVHRNLVVFTQRPTDGARLLITDNQLDQVQNRTPAVFWISHPNNHFTGNVAAESVGTGYWIIPHTAPTGESAKAVWAPLFGGIDGTQAPLGTFANNVAHSCKSAFDVNDTLRDQPLGAQPPFATPEDPTDDFIWTNRSWDPPTQEVIEGFTAWGCTIGIYAGLGSGNTFTQQVIFRDCVLADNGGHVQLACSFIVEDSLLVHDSNNRIFGRQSGHDFQQGFAQVIYDGPAQMYRCHLVGYDGPDGHSVFYDGFGAARRHTNHLVKSLTYEGAGRPVVNFNSYPASNPSSRVWGVVVRDIDGSLTRGVLPGVSLVTNHPMMRVVDANGATRDQRAGSNAWFSPYRWAHLQVLHYRSPNTLLSAGSLPPTSFTRLPYGTATGATFDDSAVAQAEIRQCPVIVAPNGASVPAFEYAVALNETPASGSSVDRVDLAIDDADVGDVTLLAVTFDNDPTWAPTVFLDDSSTPLAAGGTDPTVTSYTLANGVLRLRMVSPARLHRVRLHW
jgi:cell surface hyaluronidase